MRDGKIRTLDVAGSRVRLYLPDCERFAASYADPVPADRTES